MSLRDGARISVYSGVQFVNRLITDGLEHQSNPRGHKKDLAFRLR